MDSKYCTIYIVRHGETDQNLNHLIQGQTDNKLNDTGRLQARNLAQKMKDIKFDAVFSSDFLRTKETAEIIILEKKLKVQTTKALRERRWGRLEGQSTKIIRTIEEIKKKLSREERLKYKPHDDIENDNEIASRMFTFLREVAVGYMGKTILVVSHGGVMRIVLDHLGKKVPHGAASNTAYIKLESDGVDFFVRQTEGIKFDE